MLDASERRTHLVFGVSTAMMARLQELGARTGEDIADLLNKAVGFYKAAAEAERSGKSVCFLDANDNIETEFSGF